MHPDCSMNCVTGCRGPGDSGHVQVYYIYCSAPAPEPEEEYRPSWGELNRKFWQRKGPPVPREMKSIICSEVENKVMRWMGVALMGGQK